MRTVYLDHNATTPVLPEALDAMLPWFTERFANPSSSHPDGQAARRAIDAAREQVAGLVGARPEEVVFTGSGTEANNLAIRGVLQRTGGRLVLSAIEHPATARNTALFPHTVLPVGPDGRVVDSELPPDTALVSVMHANNETGILQPVRALADRAHARGAVVHTDAAQSVGKVPVDLDTLGADLLSFAGHKLYGPKGIGVLVHRVPIEPVLLGAGHESGRRPGTENVPAIVGLGVAAAAARRDLDALAARLRRNTERLWSRLNAGIPGLRRTSPPDSLPNTLHLRVPGSGRTLLQACPSVAAGTGSACHAGVETPSAVLLAMGLPPEDALGALRLTLGRSTTEDDVDYAADALVQAYCARSRI